MFFSYFLKKETTKWWRATKLAGPKERGIYLSQRPDLYAVSFQLCSCRRQKRHTTRDSENHDIESDIKKNVKYNMSNQDGLIPSEQRFKQQTEQSEDTDEEDEDELEEDEELPGPSGSQDQAMTNLLPPSFQV